MNVDKLKMNTKKTKYMIVKDIKKERKVEIILSCADGTN